MPARRRLPWITLTTDLGSAYAAQMKAVLAHFVPPGHLVDLTHEIAPHRIDEAAFLLRAMARDFPAGTVHIVVVDPGVGGRRHPIAIRTSDGSTLVGPDNGVLWPLARSLGVRRAVRLDPARSYRPERVGTTFDGRDLFAPVAGRIARGARLAAFGPTIEPRRYEWPTCIRSSTGALGQILHIDRFGNLITNIPTEVVPTRAQRIDVRWRRRSFARLPWVTSYESLPSGKIGLLGSSFGYVEIAVPQGNAARRWRARVGERLSVKWSPARR
jgi:S-adenosyl-L-methionine hydrolase (adenosine-forming)